MQNGGRIEVAQEMAGHESARTTGLYNRVDDEDSLDEIVPVPFDLGLDLKSLLGTFTDKGLCRKGCQGGS